MLVEIESISISFMLTSSKLIEKVAIIVSPSIMLGIRQID
jgi:hypothetical protein